MVEGAVDLVLPEHPVVEGIVLVGTDPAERDGGAVGQAREQHDPAVEVSPTESGPSNLLAASDASIGHRRVLRVAMASSREAPVATATMLVSPRATARQTPSQPGSRRTRHDPWASDRRVQDGFGLSHGCATAPPSR